MITELFLPQLTSTMEEGAIVNWLKSEGDQVEADEPVVEIETDKAIMEVESPAEGVLLKILVEEGEECPVLAPIALIGAPEDDVSEYQPTVVPAVPEAGESEPVISAAEVASAPAAAPGRVVASPRARRLAGELSVDLGTVTGSGPGGRITAEDVRRAAATALPAPASSPSLLPFTGIRKAVASQMARSKQEIPHFYLTSEIDMTVAAALLNELKPAWAEQEVKLTYTSLVVRAAALALREVPRLNAQGSAEGLHLLPQIKIGVAVAAREGLLVPGIGQTDQKSLREVAQELQDLAERAKSGSLPADAFRDKSFTVTSLGTFPVAHFAAIINPPEVGILAVGRVKDAVVADEGNLCIRPQLAVTLSCDHRAVDGVIGGQFLQHLAQALQTREALVGDRG